MFASRLALICVTLSLACSPGAPDSGAPDAGADAGLDAGPADAGARDPWLAADAYCESIAPFFCRFYLRCGRMAAADDAECRAVFAESCEAKYEPRYESLARASLLKLSADGVRACEVHLENVACERQVLDLDGPCGSMWVGTQPAGSKCGFDVESFVCEPGTACVLGPDFCGRCVATVEVGDACGDGRACPPDASCLEGRCVARGRAGDGCDSTRRCVVGVSCVDGECVAPQRAGVDEPCDQAHRCPYAASCVQGFCRSQGLLGGQCTPQPGCASGWCDEGTCAAPLADGASCTSSGSCASGLCREGRCDALPGRCFD